MTVIANQISNDTININEQFYELDARGVRAFVRYSTVNGKWSIEFYRKKRKGESEGEHDWKMIREGHVQCYYSRKDAELKALELAKQICLDNGF